MMTQEEAKATRCCGPTGCGEQRIYDPNTGDTARYCIASACMGWRWQPQGSMDNPTRVPGGGTQQIKRVIGYCGLAGRP